jgi:hypothetical protein
MYFISAIESNGYKDVFIKRDNGYISFTARHAYICHKRVVPLDDMKTIFINDFLEIGHINDTFETISGEFWVHGSLRMYHTNINVKLTDTLFGWGIGNSNCIRESFNIHDYVNLRFVTNRAYEEYHYRQNATK